MTDINAAIAAIVSILVAIMIVSRVTLSMQRTRAESAQTYAAIIQADSQTQAVK
jgi:hypothetical protein